MPRDTSREHVPTYELLVDGGELAQEHRDRIKEIRVVDYLRLPDVCTIEHLVPEDGGDRQPAVRDRQAARGPARRARAAGAAGPVQGRRRHARADLRRRRLRADRRTPTTARTCCTAAARSATFQNQTATDIVKKVVGEQGLAFEGDVERRPARLHPAGQRDRLGLHLAARRALSASSSSSRTSRRTSASRAAPARSSWSGRRRSPLPPAGDRRPAGQRGHACFAHDPKTKSAIEAQRDDARADRADRHGARRASRARSPRPTMHVATEPVKSMAEGTALAQALLDKLANGYVAAEGVGARQPEDQGGRDGQRQGRRQPFSGSYRVATSTHVLRGGGAYETHVRQRARAHDPRRGRRRRQPRRPTSAPSSCSASSRTTTTRRTSGASACSTPRWAASAEGAWARIATPSAGNERGLLMLPRRRRGGARRLRARRHAPGPTCSARCSTASTAPGDDLLHGQGRLVRRAAATRTSTTQAKETLHDQGRRATS